MARRHRHHRKIRQTKLADQPSSAQVDTQPPVVQSKVSHVTTSVVTKDLLTTALTTGALVIALIICSYLNSRYQWTQSLGSLLYRFLHIR
jgi:hypothetical protein